MNDMTLSEVWTRWLFIHYMRRVTEVDVLIYENIQRPLSSRTCQALSGASACAPVRAGSGGPRWWRSLMVAAPLAATAILSFTSAQAATGPTSPGATAQPAAAQKPFCAALATPMPASGGFIPETNMRPVAHCFSTKQEMLDWVASGGFDRSVNFEAP